MNPMAPAVAQRAGLSKWQWWLIAALVLLLWLLQRWLFRPILLDYFPTLDEIGVRAGSMPIGGPINPWRWFTHGFEGYFVPYPEWGGPGSDFWRPLVNGYYWLSYHVFGQHGADQLLVGYAAHALVVGLVCYLSVAVLRLRWWLAAAAVAIAICNPSYLQQDTLLDPFLIPRAIQYPIYQIEIFDALLVVLALLAFLERRFALFSLLTMVALLFKETAVSAPLCALALTGVWRHAERRQSLKNFAWLLAPLVIWSAGIAAMLLQHADSVYALALNEPLP